MSDEAIPGGAVQIFRKEALDRLSSPEQLDRVITVTKAYDWLGIATLGTLLAMAVLWSIFGSVPTLVKGSGILIAAGGRVFDALAEGDGVVMEVLVKPGDTVTQNAPVARISQGTLMLQLENARAVAAERKGQLEDRRRQIETYSVSQRENLAARRRTLEDRIASSEQRATAVELQLQTEERMFHQRLITWQKLHESRQELAMARQTALDAKSQLVQVEAELLNARHADERDLAASKERLADAERQIAELELQLRQRQFVRSPAAGRVTELKVAVGNRVGPGLSVASIESGITGLQLILYLPPDQGKLIRPGMQARIGPSTVKREEYGMIIGKVLDISEFPATAQAMLAYLGNERLVQQFSARGAPFAAEIELARDPSTPTGYRWSGGTGPVTVLSSGTLADAEVTVREEAPISFVIPLLRKGTGLDR